MATLINRIDGRVKFTLWGTRSGEFTLVIGEWIIPEGGIVHQHSSFNEVEYNFIKSRNWLPVYETGNNTFSVAPHDYQFVKKGYVKKEAPNLYKGRYVVG